MRQLVSLNDFPLPAWIQAGGRVTGDYSTHTHGEWLLVDEAGYIKAALVPVLAARDGRVDTAFPVGHLPLIGNQLLQSDATTIYELMDDVEQRVGITGAYIGQKQRHPPNAQEHLDPYDGEEAE